MSKSKQGKGNLYITLTLVTALATPFVSALSGRIPANTVDLLRGVLIGMAIVFLAAGARSLRTSASRQA
jgi:hypothetical protein